MRHHPVSAARPADCDPGPRRRTGAAPRRSCPFAFQAPCRAAFTLAGCERHGPHAHAGRVEDRVRDRRRHDSRGRLAGAPRLLGRPVDQVDHDLGHVREGQNRVARPVEACDGAAIEGDLLHQHPADGLDDVAVELVAHAVRINDLAAILDHEEARHPHLPCVAIDLDLGHAGHVGAIEFVLYVGDPAAAQHVARDILHRRGARLPLGEVGNPLQHLDAARILKRAQAVLQRVGAGCRRAFVEEGLVGVGVLHPPGGADPGGPERRRGQPVADRAHVREGVGQRRVADDVAGRHRGLVRQVGQ